MTRERTIDIFFQNRRVRRNESSFACNKSAIFIWEIYSNSHVKNARLSSVKCILDTFTEKVVAKLTVAIEIVQRRWTSSFAVYESFLFGEHAVKLSFFLFFSEDGNRRDSKSTGAFAPVSKEFLRSRKRPPIAILGPVWVSGALNARDGREWPMRHFFSFFS